MFINFSGRRSILFFLLLSTMGCCGAPETREGIALNKKRAANLAAIEKALEDPELLNSLAASLDSGGGYEWRVPVSWVASEGSSMRLGSYKATVQEEEGDISLIRLAGTAGGVVPNVGRWATQLGLDGYDAKRVEAEQRKVGSNAGDFLVWTLDNSEAGQATCGAMLNTADHVLFVKLTGSSKLVSSLVPEFEHFLRSFRPE